MIHDASIGSSLYLYRPDPRLHSAGRSIINCDLHHAPFRANMLVASSTILVTNAIMVMIIYIATNQFGLHGINIFRQVYSALLPDDGAASLAGAFAPLTIRNSPHIDTNHRRGHEACGISARRTDPGDPEQL